MWWTSLTMLMLTTLFLTFSRMSRTVFSSNEDISFTSQISSKVEDRSYIQLFQYESLIFGIIGTLVACVVSRRMLGRTCSATLLSGRLCRLVFRSDCL